MEVGQTAALEFRDSTCLLKPSRVPGIGLAKQAWLESDSKSLPLSWSSLPKVDKNPTSPTWRPISGVIRGQEREARDAIQRRKVT